MSTGLRRELYYLRDIGYVEVEGIAQLPDRGTELCRFVRVTKAGQAFVDLRLEVEKKKGLRNR